MPDARASVCPICARGYPLDILAELSTAWVTGRSEAPLPGYACVVAKRHVAEPFELDEPERAAFWADCMQAARALATLFLPRKVNYEIHGNTIAHLHMHLYPRYVGDPYEGGPISSQAKFQRSSEELAKIGQAIHDLDRDRKPDLIDSIPLLDGHADVWRIFLDQSLFHRVITQLASPFLTEGVTKVASVEARGFILGPAVGMQLKAGFLAIRQPGGVFPGPLIECRADPDWRNMNHVLRIQRHPLVPTDRVLLVDDWIETGSHALAARALIEGGGATFVGTSVIIDQVPSNIRGRLGKFHALITAGELGAQR